MRQTLCASPGKTVCSSCSRTVQMVRVGSGMVAVEAEVVRIVPAAANGANRVVAETMPGRRVHAEVCETYRIEDERQKIRKEMAQYNKRQVARPARRGRL